MFVILCYRIVNKKQSNKLDQILLQWTILVVKLKIYWNPFGNLCFFFFSLSNFNQFESNWAAAMAWGVKHVFHYACKIERTNVCWRLFPVLWPVLSSTNHLQCPTDKCQKSMCNPCFNRFCLWFEFKGGNLTLLGKEVR